MSKATQPHESTELESAASRRDSFVGVRYDLDGLTAFIQDAAQELSNPSVELSFNVDDEKFRCRSVEAIRNAAASLPNKLKSFQLVVQDGEGPENGRVGLEIADALATLSVDGQRRTWVRGTFITLRKNLARHQTLLARNPVATFVALVILLIVPYVLLTLRYPLMQKEHLSASESSQLWAAQLSDPIALILLSLTVLGLGGFALIPAIVSTYVLLKAPAKWLQAPEWTALGTLVGILAIVVSVVLWIFGRH